MSEKIYNAWGKIFSNPELLPKDKFVVIGGNEEVGVAYTKQELITNWRKELRYAIAQDISIYYNGNIVRTVRNFNSTILGKSVRWSNGKAKFVKTEYVKHYIIV
jgi:hypothetical protein